MATEINKPVSPTVRKAPPLPKANNDAASNEVTTTAVNNAPANNAPANNAAANNGAPANNAPANNAVANNSGPANNAPANNAEATVAPPKTDSPNHVMGFFEGFVKEAVDTATGLYTLVTTNPITTAKGLVYMATHPKLAVQAITEPYTTAWKDGKYGEVAGRAGFQVLTVVLSSGALSKSGKGAQVGTKTVAPTATATQAAEKAVADMSTRLGRKTAEAMLEKQIAEGGVKFATTQARNAALKKLATEQTAKYAERLAARNIAQKMAEGIAKSGVADDAITKIMGSAGGKVTADNVYRFAAQGLKAGLKPEQIAAEMGKFGAMGAKKAAVEFPIALKLMQAQAAAAPVLAAVASPSNAGKVAAQLQQYDRMIAGTGDDALKQGLLAQKEALQKAVSANPRTQSLVTDILAGKKIGAAERRMANMGANIDKAGAAIGEAGRDIADGGNAVKKFLDGPKTIGDYGKAIGSVPRAIGGVVDAAYDGTVAVLKKGLDLLPEFKGFKMPDIAKVRVPSPWEVITAPVTVPLGATRWALTNPGRALGVASLAGTVTNVGRLGDELKNRPADDPTENLDPGYRHYELQEGDTLESIAEKELGDASRWEEIYDLNREMFDALGNDGSIAAGTKIKLPSGGAVDGPAGAEGYKAGLLTLIDARIAEAQDPEVKAVLGQLKGRIAGMPAEEVLKLKSQLDEQGLVVPGPANNAPANNAPANNAPANNAPANNAPANNAPANNKPGNNAPVNNAPANNAPANNKPATPAPVEYTVKRGDTLQGISQSQLGSWQRWRELVDLNKAKYPSLTTNPDFIAVDWKLQLPAKASQTAPTVKPAPAKPATPATPTPAPAANAPAANNGNPAEPSKAQRDEITKQFKLEGSDANWKSFWNEISQYPTTTVGPDTGSEAARKSMQGVLAKLGYKVEATGSYFGADGKPNATAESVVDFKRRAGLTQGYTVLGANGKPEADVNEYVDNQTKETMQIALRLLQNPAIRGKAAMDAAVKEAARLQASSIGAEVGSKEARVLVQQYLSGAGYNVQPSGEFDKATTDALIDFKRKNNLSTLKDDQGRPVYTPYVDGVTAEALYEAVYKAGDKKK